jgi:ATP-dependent Lhr-like helicase
MEPTITDDRLTCATAVSAEQALSLFPALAPWFAQRFGDPTPIQCLAWPAVHAGNHVLISAPTGTGKTLAAFLPILSSLLQDTGSVWRVGSTLRVLYLSPLRALANDIARTLEGHLADLAVPVGQAGSLPSDNGKLPTCPTRVRIAVRHGDTPHEERRALREDPPDILLTTPESLAVMLSQAELLPLFADLRWVVVDEVHALAAGKRGADLALSLERLVQQCGEGLQRIGLSATATPLDQAARFLAGSRACTVAASPTSVQMDLALVPLEPGAAFLGQVLDRLERELEGQRSTLIFTNTRSLAERLSWGLRRRRPAWSEQIAVHHSALAAERRREVERDFKEGRLRAVVSSTSLELGIDIGPVDLVVLVHPPGDVVRLLQRVGRAGHGPGRVRRGLVLTGSPAELLEAAVTCASGQSGQCEPLHVPESPLDVLCQQLAGMCCSGTWEADALFDLVRRAYPFHSLAQADFDDCLAYLRGLDRTGTEWLPARLRGALTALTIRDRRTARLVRQNLGTILDEQHVTVVVPQQPRAQSGEQRAKSQLDPSGSPLSALRSPLSEDDFAEPRYREIGEIDEHFAERLQAGDRFLLDGRCLEVRRREGTTLHVDEAGGRPMIPHWAGSGWPLSTELARRLYHLRIQAAEALRDGPDALAALLRRDYGLDQRAAAILTDWFEAQECVSEIPEPGVCLIEGVLAGESESWYLHTPLNRAGNDALSRVMAHRLARAHRVGAVSIVADLGLVILPRDGSLANLARADVPGFWRSLLAPACFAEDLDAALGSSVALRERFQRVATTGLMLLRTLQGRRRVGGRDWGERRLFEQVRAHDPDFVLLRQSVREVRAELCDGLAALRFVEELPRWVVRCRWLSQPSPFAASWTQTALGGVESAQSPAEALRRLHAQLTGQPQPDGA